MNAFSDLVVAFGSDRVPTSRRLDNPWTAVAVGPGGVWSGACADPGPSARSSAAVPGWSMWCIGEIFSYRSRTDEPLNRFLADVSQSEADPALLDAQALVVAWDETRRELHVWTDRMGTTHGYVGGAAGARRCGTFLPAVAEGSPRNLDWEAITGFCGFGFYPADRTMYDDVHIVRPATWLVLDDQGDVAREHRYWDWTFDPDHSRSDDDLLDEFGDVWSRVVAARIGDRRIVVPLSGGLDSRTVFAVATGATDALATFSYGYARASSELAIARAVARTRGVRHRELVVQSYVFDRLEDVVDAVEGMQSLSFSRQAGVSGEMRELGDRVAGGHWGDVWFDASAGQGPHQPVLEEAYTKFAKNGRAWLLEHVCAPRLGGQAPDTILRQFLSDELARLPDLGDAAMQLKMLKTEQWSFRWTLASTRAYQLGAPTVLPFYANDIVDFFARVPTSRLVGRRLQAAYLRRHHPDLAKVRWQQTDVSLYARPTEQLGALGRRALRKAGRVLGTSTVPERNWEVQYLTGTGPSLLRLQLGQAARAGLSSPESMDALACAFLDDPGPGTGYAVDAALTLSPYLG